MPFPAAAAVPSSCPPAPLPSLQVSVEHNAALHGVALEDVELHRISFMEKRRVIWGMLRCVGV